VCVCFCACVLFCVQHLLFVGCYDVVFKNPKKKVYSFCEIFVEFLLLMLLFFAEVVFW
jgi:hypothetical protein